MGIKGFEGRLERAVEGTFSRLFRSGLSPVEFGRKLERELDAELLPLPEGGEIAQHRRRERLRELEGCAVVARIPRSTGMAAPARRLPLRS